MIYGYIRVSTDKQTTENQRYEITKFCEKNDIQIDEWVEETISATKDISKRKLGGLIETLHPNDIIIASELSRLGRKLLEVMAILNHCVNNEAKVWTIKDNFRLDTDIQSKVLAFAFGLAAEIERNLISQRTKEALAARRANGVILGRPKGKLNSHLKLESKCIQIKDLLNKGVSQRQIARQLHVSRNTLSLFMHRFDICFNRSLSAISSTS